MLPLSSRLPVRAGASPWPWKALAPSAPPPGFPQTIATSGTRSTRFASSAWTPWRRHSPDIQGIESQDGGTGLEV